MTETSKATVGPGTVGPVARPGRRTGLLLVVGGLIGLVAAVVLLVEKIALTINPEYIPTCSINPILSCGTVMNTSQAAVFGLPNPIIGIAGFAAVAVVGAAILAGGIFQRWFWIGMQVGVTFAVVFVHWLIYQSLYVIGALCPYCMIVWAVTIPIFWLVTVQFLQPLLHSVPVRGKRVIEAITEFRGAILTAWCLVVLILIAHRFWDYWTSLV